MRRNSTSALSPAAYMLLKRSVYISPSLLTGYLSPRTAMRRRCAVALTADVSLAFSPGLVTIRFDISSSLQASSSGIASIVLIHDSARRRNSSTQHALSVTEIPPCSIACIMLLANTLASWYCYLGCIVLFSNQHNHTTKGRACQHPGARI